MSSVGLSCRDARERLPWLANGTLAGSELATVERHLGGCADCRTELERCRAERELVRADPVAAPTPHPAQLDRLFARIDAGDGETIDERAAATSSPTRSVRALLRRTPAPVRWVFAAQWLALAGLGLYAFRPVPEPLAPFRTLSDAAPARASVATLRVVFAPEATEADVRSILLAAGLEIVAGPTTVGAYGLAPVSERSDRASGGDPLSLLRADPRVRFAEPVVGLPEADAPPR